MTTVQSMSGYISRQNIAVSHVCFIHIRLCATPTIVSDYTLPANKNITELASCLRSSSVLILRIKSNRYRSFKLLISLDTTSVKL